ncbi:MAG: hypothetical protein F4Y03_04800 [Alphaproteobacteria bacterium]|nr:hypothetical protein [Alphaproteobacteria bacterium]
MRRIIRCLSVLAAVAVHGAGEVSAKDFLLLSDLTERQKQSLATEVKRIGNLDRYDWRRQFYARCDPVFPQVLLSPEKEFHLPGLTVEAIGAAVESRFRAARIFAKSSYQYVLVQVSLGDRIHLVSVRFIRHIDDLGGGLGGKGIGGSATLWSATGFGANATADTILASVSRGIDQFLTRYLRANELPCKMKWARGQ